MSISAAPRCFQIGAACLWALIVSACAAEHPLDDLAQGETGRVVRIIDGDALVLDTGLSVRLVGIEAPAPERRNREGQAFADEATRLLEDMALGREVRLVYPGLTRDRYDRALAYVRTYDNLGPELWLNEEMIRFGGARARIYPDTAELGDAMVRLEGKARADKAGMWALEDWSVPAAQDVADDAQGFYIVRGALGPVQPPSAGDDEAVCRRRLRASALVLNVLVNAGALCHQDERAQWQEGMAVRVRGYLREGVLEISHIYNAEPLVGADLN